MTELVEEEAELQKEQLILKEQELSNLLHQKDYVRAVGVAISLGQPFRVLNILQGQHSQMCVYIITKSFIFSIPRAVG